jgi:hypothetical protein
MSGGLLPAGAASARFQVRQPPHAHDAVAGGGTRIE